MKVKRAVILIIAVLVIISAILGFALTREKYNNAVHGFFVMGSYATVTVYDAKDADDIAAEAAEQMSQLDSKYLSHTVSSSAVSQLNSERTVTADEYFINYLKKCTELTSECEGFTLLSGQLKELWKTEEGGRVPADNELAAVIPDISMENIVIDGNKVSLLNGAKLDLGALGKGTACQTGVDMLKNSGVKNGMCLVGGTVGVFGSPKDKERFSIGVRNPFGSANEYIGTLSVTDCFISTSGDYEKYFVADGVRYCHIFDAVTGKPVQNNLTSVTAVANDGTVSDFLSTAIYINGEEKGLELAEKFGAEIIIIRKDKTVYVSDGLKDNFDLTDGNFKII